MSSRKAPSARTDTVAATVQADEPCRLVRVGKPSWEVLIDRLEYNMPAWNASNWIVKHNLKIIRHVQHIQDYEMGKRSDPPPFSFAEVLNPRTNARSPSVKRNTGLDRLDYLFASLKRYEPGHAPAQNYEPVFISTRALLLLLKKCADVYGRRPEEQQLSRSLECVYAFQRFVEDTATLHLTRQEYDAKLDAMPRPSPKTRSFSKPSANAASRQKTVFAVAAVSRKPTARCCGRCNGRRSSARCRRMRK